ncbi:MAG: pilus assembly protein PilM [Candidatus Hinthialibacter antarcticus]|nr:pilus assembly protein PilM [Candidatus Hinthialibacter antarcticus]
MEGVSAVIGSQSSVYKSIIGIEFERESVKAVSAVKNGHGLKIKKTLSAPIEADWLLSNPDRLGEEIRAQFAQVGIQESHCMICLPLQWILKHRIEVPDLSPEDLQNYIRLQAERAFPFPLDELSLSTTWYQTSDGKRFASIAAVRLSHIETLRAVCKKAKLTPVSFTIGLPPDSKDAQCENAVFLKKREDGIDCQIIRQGKMIGFRFLETNWTHDLQDAVPALFRDIRVTLSELPLSVQTAIRTLVICGPQEWVDDFSRHAAPFADAMNMRRLQFNTLPQQPAVMNGDAYWISPIYQAANQFVRDKKAQIEFLPPKVNRLKQWASKISSRGSLLAGASVSIVLVVVIAALLYQHFTWSGLNSRWEKIRDQVDEVSLIQNNVRQFRPWFDESLPVLSSIQSLVEAFPEEGSVWVKIIEIDGNQAISCSGFTRDNRALSEMLNRLYQDERIQNLNLEQRLGEAPTTFTFKFQWIGN